MALVIQELKRKFSFNGVPLPDPGPEFTPDEVKDVYSAQYPDITTAIIDGPIPHEDHVEFKFVRNVGTKG
jgi:PRTRC genetic system protein C